MYTFFYTIMVQDQLCWLQHLPSHFLCGSQELLRSLPVLSRLANCARNGNRRVSHVHRLAAKLVSAAEFLAMLATTAYVFPACKPRVHKFSYTWPPLPKRRLLNTAKRTFGEKCFRGKHVTYCSPKEDHSVVFAIDFFTCFKFGFNQLL